MKLTSKIISGVSIGLVFSLMVFNIAIFYVIYPAFDRLESDEVEQNLFRIEEEITGESVHLQSIVSDWAVWDDTYEFVGSRNKRYVASNLQISSFQNADISFIYIVDENGNIVISRHCDILKSKFQKDYVFDKWNFSEKHPFFLKPGQISKNGTFFVGNNLYFVAISKIYKSDFSGDARGFLVMGRVVDSDYLNKIALKTKVSFQIYNKLISRSDDLSSRASVSELSNGRHVITWKTNKKITVIFEIEDITGAANVGIEMQYARKITVQGMTTIQIAIIFIIIATLFVSIFIIVLIRRIVVRPIANLSQMMDDIENRGDLNLRINEIRDDEIGDLGISFNRLIDRISLQAQELETLTLTDPLTKIGNRREFDKIIEMEWNRHKRNKFPLAVILLDVDYFKLYNDYYGHLMGDECLVRIAEILKYLFKRTGDFVARYGGEEFIILLNESSTEDLRNMAVMVIDAFKKAEIPHEASKIGRFLSVSLGATLVIPEDGMSIKGFFDSADSALYLAKEKGRNRYEIAEYKGD